MCLHHHLTVVTPPTKLDYVDSPEARKLFGTREDESTRQSINAQICTLQAANDGDKGI
jgi:hypothetical protein